MYQRRLCGHQKGGAQKRVYKRRCTNIKKKRHLTTVLYLPLYLSHTTPHISHTTSPTSTYLIPHKIPPLLSYPIGANYHCTVPYHPIPKSHRSACLCTKSCSKSHLFDSVHPVYPKSSQDSRRWSACLDVLARFSTSSKPLPMHCFRLFVLSLSSQGCWRGWVCVDSLAYDRTFLFPSNPCRNIAFASLYSCAQLNDFLFWRFIDGALTYCRNRKKYISGCMGSAIQHQQYGRV